MAIFTFYDFFLFFSNRNNRNKCLEEENDSEQEQKVTSHIR